MFKNTAISIILTISAETLARTTADGLQNTAISNNTDAITAEALARTTADGLKTQLFLIRMQ
jgi:hypothetical protein